MVATYQIIQSTDASTNQIILQEEANFLLRKIDAAITGARRNSFSYQQGAFCERLFEHTSAFNHLGKSFSRAVHNRNASADVLAITFCTPIRASSPCASSNLDRPGRCPKAGRRIANSHLPGRICQVGSVLLCPADRARSAPCAFVSRQFRLLGGWPPPPI